MIQPKYGNTGDDHGASRSRRITMPRFTALSATIANAIVIEIDGSVGARLVGTPLQHREREAGDDEAADQPADHLGPGDDPRAGLARRPLHDARDRERRR